MGKKIISIIAGCLVIYSLAYFFVFDNAIEKVKNVTVKEMLPFHARDDDNSDLTINKLKDYGVQFNVGLYKSLENNQYVSHIKIVQHQLGKDISDIEVSFNIGGYKVLFDFLVQDNSLFSPFSHLENVPRKLTCVKQGIKATFTERKKINTFFYSLYLKEHQEVFLNETHNICEIAFEHIR